MPPDGPVGIVGEPDAMDGGDRGDGAERLAGVGGLEGASGILTSCWMTAAGRLRGAAPHAPVSGRVIRSLPNEPLPPLMP